MDSKTDFVFYRDEKNNVFSGGYRINNMFKDLDIPVVQQKGGSSLVIPMGLFYTKNDFPINEYEINQRGGEIDDGLFNKLLELSMKDEINGCLYETEDPNGLYNKLLLLLSNEEHLNKLTIGAKKTDISKWSLKYMGKNIDDLYNSRLVIK